MVKRVLILGAAGRDFHNFNVFFRDNENYKVIGFTATQIPGIEGRKYPPSLAGKLYPEGIPIYLEEEMEKIIKEKKVDIVVFSYSDVSHVYVMNRASRALACGADFWILGPESTMLKSEKKVISVCAVRTGSGKSQTSRKIAKILKDIGKKVGVVRHPMPYGDLDKMKVQKFVSKEDLVKYKTTIEEREEYEPHISMGFVVYAGVDYQEILKLAEKENDVILWEGGNNDFPFFKPDLHIVVADPLRLGHEETYHPGETNIRMADVVVINKIDFAPFENVYKLRLNIERLNPRAKIVEAASPIYVDNPDVIREKRVLCIEDGPTLTHGEMDIGAAYVAAKKYGAKEIVSPISYAVGSIKSTFEKYPNTGKVLPAMGYSEIQIEELRETIRRTPCDAVIIGTPINLANLFDIGKPWVKVRYELQEIGEPTLEEILKKFFGKL
ncbi:MAG: cyclic 2,3-diphosphoglycerate synthase [Candidatus Hydrothermales bacterium]